MAIISYDDLEMLKADVLADLHALKAKEIMPKGFKYRRWCEVLLAKELITLKSHMALQIRNEKLRTQNARLVEMLKDVRKAANGGRA